MKLRGFEVISDWQDKDVHLPQRQTGASAGYDIEAAADCVIPAGGMVSAPVNNEVRDEAVSALTMLGFAPAPTQKVVMAILKEQPDLPVEQVVKLALKQIK
jgi:Holliday junction resolvasome RuvABC DNA-binding subunit